MFVCCESCVLSGSGLCDGLITRPEKSYRLWCVVKCDLETSLMERPWPTGGKGGGAVAPRNRNKKTIHICVCVYIYIYICSVPNATLHNFIPLVCM